MAMRNALNDAVETESAKVVGHPSDRVVGWIEAQQLRQECTHFLIVEATQLETEYDQGGEQGLHALVAKAQGGGPLPFYLVGTNHSIKRVFANRAIVRNLLDVE